MRRSPRLGALALTLAFNAIPSSPAVAWGDEGHEVIALIAQAHLEPRVRKKLDALLAAGTDPLTAHTIAAAATWPDKLRDAHEDSAPQNTRQWHFVDLELNNPNLNQACFGHPPIPPGVPASAGPARDCVVDKIEEFAAELASPATKPEEQIVALKFLLHFVGDVHQPLHAADLNGQISTDAARAWARGDASGWALEAFQVAKDDAYGQLPEAGPRGSFRLSDQYIGMAMRDVAIQLSKAGVRLAFVLNTALRSKP